MPVKDSSVDSRHDAGTAFLKNAGSFLNSSFFTATIVGAIAWLYSSVWVPDAAERNERRDLLFELHLRVEKAISDKDKAIYILDGLNNSYILPKYETTKFRGLAIRYAVLRGAEANYLRDVGVPNITKVASQLDAIQNSIDALILSEGFNFQSNKSPTIEEHPEMNGWLWAIIGTIGVVSVINLILLLIILFQLMSAALRPPARIASNDARAHDNSP